MRGYSQQNIEESILQDTQLQKDIDSLRSKTKWIDINQFLEGRRYYNIPNMIRLLYLGGLIICLGYIFLACYFHGIYFYEVLYDICDLSGWIAFIIITSIILKGIDSSKIIKNIYNIQDGDEKLRFRIAEDKKGKKGICNAGRLRIRQLLPFEYDEIFATYENSYACKKDGKYGVYNADLKKMAIPVIYDDIYSITPESIVLIKDEQKYCLTHKGYRIVK